MFISSAGGATRRSFKWYGSKHITDMSKLRGGKIGVRESSAEGGGLVRVLYRGGFKRGWRKPTD